MIRIRGLDSIRALCALWVVIGHFGVPPILFWIDRSTVSGWLITGTYGNFWNGPAAVIVFFVISGFCIYYPYSRSLRIPSVTEYLTRRYLRICIPMLAAIAASAYVGITIGLFHGSILWSLAAELVYYTIFPLFLRLRRYGVAWEWMIALSYLPAFAIASMDPASKDYAAFGLSLNWLMGLPCWLIGCALAEAVSLGRFPKAAPIWRCRFLVWGVSVICSILNFHSPLVHVWTLNLFALVAGWWLALEIRRYQCRLPSPFLERAGLGSYSLYLTHLAAGAAVSMLGLPDLGATVNWILRIGLVLGMAYLFYRLVEFPVHRLARHAGRALANPGVGSR